MNEPITLVFKPQARALKNEVQTVGGSITLQTQSPVKLGFVNDGFERYVDVVRALRGAQGERGEQGMAGSMDWDASVPDDYDPIGIINTIWST